MVARVGFEAKPQESVSPYVEESRDDVEKQSPDGEKSPPDQGGFGPTFGPIEAALAKGLEAAAMAGRFDVVAQLAKELEARRLARTSS
jgi:hypothetical protein